MVSRGLVAHLFVVLSLVAVRAANFTGTSTKTEPQGRLAIAILQGSYENILGFDCHNIMHIFALHTQMNNQFLNYYSNAKSHDVLGSIDLSKVSAVTGIDPETGWIELSFEVCYSDKNECSCRLINLPFRHPVHSLTTPAG